MTILKASWPGRGRKMSLCIITPQLPPAIDGVGDYSRIFWQHWNRENIPDLEAELSQPSFLSLGQHPEQLPELPGARIGSFAANAPSLLQALNLDGSTNVLLQYVGYGYDKNGAPAWLCDALDPWLAENSERRLYVMFHENWATGPPWKKVYWLRGHQIRCAKRLLKASAVAATSNRAIQRQLQALGCSTPVSIIPLGVTVLMPSRLPPRNFRRFLAIGRQATRLRAIKRHLNLLIELNAQGLIDELVLAGELTDGHDAAYSLVEKSLAGVKVATAYNFSGPVPELVLSAGISLMHTESGCIMKSTSFQLAVAAGQVPLTILDGELEPPLSAERHLLAYAPAARTTLMPAFREEHLEEISANLQELSEINSWPVIVRRWHELITAEGGPHHMPSLASEV